VAAIIGSYLFGGIPIGLLVGRAKGIDDIRKYGSGNIGASNVLRVIGVRAGLFVWAMDAMKGLLPVVVARYALFPMVEPVPGTGVAAGAPERLWWLAAVALAAMVGHCFSPYLKLSGGRGVSTSLGVILGLDWRVGVICFACWVAIVAVTRYISLGSMIACALAAPILCLFGAPAPLAMAIALVALVVIVRHIPNIGRLLAGTERKIGQKERPVTDTESAS